MQKLDDKNVHEIGYLYNKKYWHNGYAIEGAAALKTYAFSTLNADKVYSFVTDINVPSRKVAFKNGMKKIKEFTKPYRGIEVTLGVYCTSKY